MSQADRSDAQQPDDLHADLAAAFDSAESAPPPEAGGEPAPVAATAEPGSEPAKGERARDDAGRFAKADKPAAEQGAGAAGAAATPPQAGQPAAPAAPSINIPRNWPASVKADLERLAKMDPTLAQRWIESTRHWEGLAATERQRAEPFMRLQQALEDVLSPTRQQRQMAGMDDAAYLRALAAADQFLSRDPAAGIKWLAQKYGITPEQLVGTVQDAQASAPPREVQALMGKVAQLETYISQITQGAQHQALQGVMGTIEAFASEKGPDGNPVRPYFDECLPEIQMLVQMQRERGEPVNLQAAYDRAIRMNDAVWMRVQAQQAEKQAAERAAAAGKAKRAGFNVAGNGSASGSEEPAESLRGELERQFSKHS